MVPSQIEFDLVRPTRAMLHHKHASLALLIVSLVFGHAFVATPTRTRQPHMVKILQKAISTHKQHQHAAFGQTSVPFGWKGRRSMNSDLFMSLGEAGEEEEAVAGAFNLHIT